VNCTDLIAVYDEATQQSIDPLAAMTKHCQELSKQKQGNSIKLKRKGTQRTLGH